MWITQGDAVRSWIGTHKPSHARPQISSLKVIKAGLAIAFFAGEMKWARVATGTCSGLVIAEGEAGDEFASGAGNIETHALSAKMVRVCEVRGAGFVIGLYPAYLEAADEGGLGAYNIPGNLYRFFQATGNEWTANQAYIDAQVFFGRQAYLARPAVVSGNSTLWLELERLKTLGVQAKDWVLRHVPY